jgi:hypothetical protein
MRKIESEMIKAIKAKQSKTIDNTKIEYLCELDTPLHSRIEYTKIYLHGHHIASYAYGLDRFDYNPMTLAAWPTRTTKSRLRALGFNVYTKKGQTFVDSKLIA